MTGKGNLSPRQRRAIAALLTAKSIDAAAKAAGVSERQLHRWIDLPEFTAALRAAEGEALASVVRRLTVEAAGAVNAILIVLNDADTSPAVKLRAADLILSRVMSLRELSELDSRVRLVETRLEELMKDENRPNQKTR